MAAPDYDFTPDELAVADALLELPLRPPKSHFSLGLIPAWPLRRKRSVLDSPPDSSAADLNEPSPTSPLALNSLPLSRTHSDDNSIAKRSRKKPSLDKKSQYVEAIDDLTKRNQALKGVSAREFEAMKQHYNRPKTINSELKAKKQQMILGSKNESGIPEIGTSSSAMNVVKLPGESSNQASMNSQTAPMAEQSDKHSQNFQIPVGAIPFYDHSLGPMGIPDLNISFEEINQRSYSRFMAARARQNRIQICKNKNNNGAAAKLQRPPNPPCK